MLSDSNKLRQHGGNLKAVFQKYGPRDYLDFSANINPLGLAPAVEQALHESIKEVINYPEPDAVTFNRAAAGYLGLDPRWVISGNGAAELIYLLVRAINPRKVIIPVPTFSEYELAAASVDAQVIPVFLRAEDRFAWNADTIIKTMAQGDLLFLCNPNNPVGNLIGQESMLLILKAAEEHGTLVVVDESFRDFVDDMPTALPFLQDFQNLVVLYSLTKFFALPGLRLGCAISQPQLIGRLKAMKDCWSVNTLAQIAGCTAIKETEYISNTKEIISVERDYLYGELQKIIGLDPYNPAANYIFLDISRTGFGSGLLRERLIEKGVIVRDCATYPTLEDKYIRVAVKLRPENIKLVHALQEVLEG